jgi:hypothetical protein
MNDETSRRSSEQMLVNGKTSKVASYPAMILPEYRSPYRFRTQKTHREEKFHQNVLPAVRADRNVRPSLYEPRNRTDRFYPADTLTKATSLVMKYHLSSSRLNLMRLYFSSILGTKSC